MQNFVSFHRRSLMFSAQKEGFRVHFRSPGYKFTESEATVLYDVSYDPSSDLKVGDTVGIKGPYAPPLSDDSKQKLCVEHEALSKGPYQPFYIAAFVEVPVRIGKCRMKMLFCSLVADDYPDGASVQTEGDGKVFLYWTGSLVRMRAVSKSRWGRLRQYFQRLVRKHLCNIIFD